MLGSPGTPRARPASAAAHLVPAIPPPNLLPSASLGSPAPSEAVPSSLQHNHDTTPKSISDTVADLNAEEPQTGDAGPDIPHRSSQLVPLIIVPNPKDRIDPTRAYDTPVPPSSPQGDNLVVDPVEDEVRSAPPGSTGLTLGDKTVSNGHNSVSAPGKVPGSAPCTTEPSAMPSPTLEYSTGTTSTMPEPPVLDTVRPNAMPEPSLPRTCMNTVPEPWVSHSTNTNTNTTAVPAPVTPEKRTIPMPLTPLTPGTNDSPHLADTSAATTSFSDKTLSSDTQLAILPDDQVATVDPVRGRPRSGTFGTYVPKDEGLATLVPTERNTSPSVLELGAASTSAPAAPRPAANSIAISPPPSGVPTPFGPAPAPPHLPSAYEPPIGPAGFAPMPQHLGMAPVSYMGKPTMPHGTFGPNHAMPMPTPSHWAPHRPGSTPFGPVPYLPLGPSTSTVNPLFPPGPMPNERRVALKPGLVQTPIHYPPNYARQGPPSTSLGVSQWGPAAPSLRGSVCLASRGAVPQCGRGGKVNYQPLKFSGHNSKPSIHMDPTAFSAMLAAQANTGIDTTRTSTNGKGPGQGSDAQVEKGPELKPRKHAVVQIPHEVSSRTVLPNGAYAYLPLPTKEEAQLLDAEVGDKLDTELAGRCTSFTDLDTSTDGLNHSDARTKKSRLFALRTIKQRRGMWAARRPVPLDSGPSNGIEDDVVRTDGQNQGSMSVGPHPDVTSRDVHTDEVVPQALPEALAVAIPPPPYRAWETYLRWRTQEVQRFTQELQMAQQQPLVELSQCSTMLEPSLSSAVDSQCTEPTSSTQALQPPRSAQSMQPLQPLQSPVMTVLDRVAPEPQDSFRLPPRSLMPSSVEDPASNPPTAFLETVPNSSGVAEGPESFSAVSFSALGSPKHLTVGIEEGETKHSVGQHGYGELGEQHDATSFAELTPTSVRPAAVADGQGGRNAPNPAQEECAAGLGPFKLMDTMSSDGQPSLSFDQGTRPKRDSVKDNDLDTNPSLVSWDEEEDGTSPELGAHDPMGPSHRNAQRLSSYGLSLPRKYGHSWSSTYDHRDRGDGAMLTSRRASQGSNWTSHARSMTGETLPSSSLSGGHWINEFGTPPPSPVRLGHARVASSLMGRTSASANLHRSVQVEDLGYISNPSDEESSYLDYDQDDQVGFGFGTLGADAHWLHGAAPGSRTSGTSSVPYQLAHHGAPHTRAPSSIESVWEGHQSLNYDQRGNLLATVPPHTSPTNSARLQPAPLKPLPSSNARMLNAAAPAFQPGTPAAKSFTFKSPIPFPHPSLPSIDQGPSDAPASPGKLCELTEFARPPSARPVSIRRPEDAGMNRHHARGVSGADPELAGMDGPVLSATYESSSSRPSHYADNTSDASKLMSPFKQGHRAAFQGSTRLAQAVDVQHDRLPRPSGLPTAPLWTTRDRSISLSDNTSVSQSPWSSAAAEANRTVQPASLPAWHLTHQPLPDDAVRVAKSRAPVVQQPAYDKSVGSDAGDALMTGSDPEDMGAEVVEELAQRLEKSVGIWSEKLVRELRSTMDHAFRGSLTTNLRPFDAGTASNFGTFQALPAHPSSNSTSRSLESTARDFERMRATLDKQLTLFKVSLANLLPDMIRANQVHDALQARAQLSEESKARVANALGSRLQRSVNESIARVNMLLADGELDGTSPIKPSLDRVERALGTLPEIAQVQSNIDNLVKYVSIRTDRSAVAAQDGTTGLADEVNTKLRKVILSDAARLSTDALDIGWTSSVAADKVVKIVEEYAENDDDAEQAAELVSEMVRPLVTSLVQDFLGDVRSQTEAALDSLVDEANQRLVAAYSQKFTRKPVTPRPKPPASGARRLWLRSSTTRTAVTHSNTIPTIGTSDSSNAALDDPLVKSIRLALKAEGVDHDLLVSLIEPLNGKQEKSNADLEQLCQTKQGTLNEISELPPMARSLADRLLSSTYRAKDSYNQLLDRLGDLAALDGSTLSIIADLEERCTVLTARLDDATRGLYDQEVVRKAAEADATAQRMVADKFEYENKVLRERLARSTAAEAEAQAEATKQRAKSLRALSSEHEAQQELEKARRSLVYSSTQLSTAHTALHEAKKRAKQRQADSDAARSQLQKEREAHKAYVRSQQERIDSAEVAASAARKRKEEMSTHLMEVKAAADKLVTEQRLVAARATGEQEEMRRRLREQDQIIADLSSQLAKEKRTSSKVSAQLADANRRATDADKMSRMHRMAEATISTLQGQLQAAKSSQDELQRAKDSEATLHKRFDMYRSKFRTMEEEVRLLKESMVERYRLEEAEATIAMTKKNDKLRRGMDELSEYLKLAQSTENFATSTPSRPGATPPAPPQPAKPFNFSSPSLPATNLYPATTCPAPNTTPSFDAHPTQTFGWATYSVMSPVDNNIPGSPATSTASLKLVEQSQPTISVNLDGWWS